MLVVSPHWQARGVRVATTAAPETLHDFGGFPSVLYQLRYPAPGHPELAREAARVLDTAGFDVRLDERRGLDHGTWVPLMHLFPEADVPVFQVSLPVGIDAAGGRSAWARRSRHWPPRRARRRVGQPDAQPLRVPPAHGRRRLRAGIRRLGARRGRAARRRSAFGVSTRAACEARPSDRGALPAAARGARRRAWKPTRRSGSMAASPTACCRWIPSRGGCPFASRWSRNGWRRALPRWERFRKGSLPSRRAKVCGRTPTSRCKRWRASCSAQPAGGIPLNRA